VLIEPVGNLLDLVAGEAVDDAAIASMPIEEGQELLLGVLLFDDGVADVGPIEARDEKLGVGERQPLYNVIAGVRIGGRGQRDARHTGKQVLEPRELAVFRPEVVAPMADAMGFVDSDEG
jgi:hypothetical protein